MKVDKALIDKKEVPALLLLPRNYGIVFTKRDLGRPTIKYTRIGAACAANTICVIVTCNDGLGFIAFFGDPASKPRDNQAILEAHLKQFATEMAKERSKVTAAAVVGPDPTKPMGAALQHTVETTLKAKVTVEPIWVPTPKKGTNYAFGYSYRKNSIAFVEQKSLPKATDSALFEKFPATLKMYSLQPKVLRRFHSYEASPPTDSKVPALSYKYFDSWVTSNQALIEHLRSRMIPSVSKPDGPHSDCLGFNFTNEAESENYHVLSEAHFRLLMEVGRSYHASFAKADFADAKRLVALSERNMHVLHNATVLYLEQTPAIDSVDYERQLRNLWMEEVTANERSNPVRVKALMAYLESHSVLGKVLVTNETDFHKTGQIRLQPSYWGLFFFSKMHTADDGLYKAADAKGDAPDKRWWAYFAKEKFDGAKDAKGARVHEPVARDFTNDAHAAAGLYIVRSKAHGRDLLLYHKSKNPKKEPPYMVSVIKGVGADLDRIPEGTAGNHLTPKMRGSWNDKKNTGLPFYSVAPDQLTNAGSWATLGFNFARGWLGENETEIGAVDLDHFRAMKVFVDSLARSGSSPILNYLKTAFVDGYSLCELANLPHITQRLDATVTAAMDVSNEHFIGMPAQITSVAPNETALRIYKQHGDAQNYDFGHVELEMAEWLRATAHLTLPKGLSELYSADLRTVKAAPSALYDPAKREQRLLLAYKLTFAFFGSYAVFAKRGWTSHTQSGSFSGRNFNVGPRDSNEWGPTVRGIQVDANAVGEVIGTRGLLNIALGIESREDALLVDDETVLKQLNYSRLVHTLSFVVAQFVRMNKVGSHELPVANYYKQLSKTFQDFYAAWSKGADPQFTFNKLKLPRKTFLLTPEIMGLFSL